MSKELTEEQRKKIVELYPKLKSSRAVGKALGLSHTVILNVCRQAGAEIQAPHINNSTKVSQDA